MSSPFGLMWPRATEILVGTTQKEKHLRPQFQNPFTFRISILSPCLKLLWILDRQLREDYHDKRNLLANFLKHHKWTIVPFIIRQSGHTSIAKGTKINDVLKKKKKLFQRQRETVTIIIEFSLLSQFFGWDFITWFLFAGWHGGRDQPWNP